MVEDLIEIVAASFARHGIECPQDPPSTCGDVTLPLPSRTELNDSAPLVAFQEHHYGKILQGDPSP